MNNFAEDGDIQASHFLLNFQQTNYDIKQRKINRRSSANNVDYITELEQQRQKNYNAINSGVQPSDNPKSFQPLYIFRCRECDLTCSSQENLNQHKKGKRHALTVGKVDAILDKDILPPDERSKIVLNSLGINKDYISLSTVSATNICRYTCKLCDVFIFEADLDLHLKGRKHIEQLENATGLKQPKKHIGPDAKMIPPNERQRLFEEMIVTESQPQFQQQPFLRQKQHFLREEYPMEENKEMRYRYNNNTNQRERILDLRERRLILRESACAKREIEVAQREVKLKIQEVKLLSSTYDQSPAKNGLQRLKRNSNANDKDSMALLTSSEQKYYNDLMSQKNELQNAINTLGPSDKSLLTMEERSAKNELNLALADIQLALNNLLQKKNKALGECDKSISVSKKNEAMTMTHSDCIKKWGVNQLQVRSFIERLCKETNERKTLS